MKQLSKQQNAQRDEFVIQLRRAAEGVSAKYAAYVAATEEYNAEMDKYNTVVAEVEQFSNEITSDMQSYMDEKSERWSEGETGTSYGDWKDTWEGISFEQLEHIEVPNEPAMEDFIQEFDDLPDAP